jgi:hypothetical protein
MPDGDQGLEHWLNGFAEHFWQGLDMITRDRVIHQIADECRPTLFHDGQWHIDYQRLRIVAEKPVTS